MKVLALTSYSRLGASSRVRIYQYIPKLAELGIECDVRPLLGETYMKERYANPNKARFRALGSFMNRVKDVMNRDNYDLVWLQRELFPWVPGVLEKVMASGDVPDIVDYDDAVFHRYDNHRLSAVRKVLGKKIDRIMAGADCVVAGNEYLNQRAIAAGAAMTRLIPSVIDIDRYQIKQWDRMDRPLQVGWIGTPVTAKFLDLLQGPLSAVSCQTPLELVTVGSGDIQIDGVNTRVYPWTEDSEAERILQFDIGVMPLTDAKWERGKCGYKLIQYMASGIPVIAAPVGVNQQIVEHNVDGWLAQDESAWTEYLLSAASNRQSLIGMGLAGRKKVEGHYCVQKTVHDLAQVFRQVVNG